MHELLNCSRVAYRFWLNSICFMFIVCARIVYNQQCRCFILTRQLIWTRNIIICMKFAERWAIFVFFHSIGTMQFDVNEVIFCEFQQWIMLCINETECVKTAKREITNGSTFDSSPEFKYSKYAWTGDECFDHKSNERNHLFYCLVPRL